jgi:hypothetical protein
MTQEKYTEQCETCDGTGEVHSHNPRCWNCDGTGIKHFKADDLPEGAYVYSCLINPQTGMRLKGFLKKSIAPDPQSLYGQYNHKILLDDGRYDSVWGCVNVRLVNNL